MSEEKLKTISSTIDQNSRDLTIRHTLQPKQTVIPVNGNSLDRARSKSYVQLPQRIVIQPAILEEDSDVEQGGRSRNANFIKNPIRSNSMTGVKAKAKIFEIKEYDNGGYNNDGMQNTNFQRGYMDSSRSSAHDSVHSLQVQREQYCCFSRWSPFERRLALSVAILAGVILGLVVAVGFLAKRDGIDKDFLWTP